MLVFFSRLNERIFHLDNVKNGKYGPTIIADYNLLKLFSPPMLLNHLSTKKTRNAFFTLKNLKCNEDL